MKPGEQKQVRIQRKDTIKIRQCLGKAGYNENWLRKEPLVTVMVMLAIVMSEEEEEKERALMVQKEKEEAEKAEKEKEKEKEEITRVEKASG